MPPKTPKGRGSPRRRTGTGKPPPTTHPTTVAQAQAQVAQVAQNGRPGNLSAARIGQQVHRWITDGLRPTEGTLLHGGEWEVFSIDRTVGGKGRPDEVYINHTTKQVLVVDTYTGPVETAAHNAKGWLYAKEPQIANLLNQKYTYVYMPAMYLNRH
jgi:hypothetical protein